MQIRLRQLTVVVSADGKRAVSRTLGGKTRDYEEGMQRVETVAREVPISDLFDKPDSPETRSFLATSTVCLWDLDGKPKLRLLEGHGSPISCLAITPDGRRALSGSAGRGVRAWNLDAGTQLWTLRGHQGIVSSVAITVDGRRGVSASEDSTLSMWNLETGQPIATFTGEARMGMCQISPDGRVVIAQEPTGRLHLLRLCGAAE
jgi:WD40 repeat protein